MLMTLPVSQWKKKELVFLDVQVKREEDRFLTSVYKNKTFTDFYLNFQSNCSLKKKRF